MSDRSPAKLTPVRRALVSVSDKSNLDVLARALSAHGVEVLSTGGTARALAELGLKVRPVAEHTGAPEILGGRVKTLHPRIHGGILARPTAAHEAELAEHDIPPIDLVVVNLYPFRETVARPEVTFEEAVEKIDIGGPTMVRAAAKNAERLCVVVDPADYGRLAEALEAGGTTVELRRELQRKAFGHTAAYDAAIATWLDAQAAPAPDPGTPPPVPERLFVAAERSVPLRYGENPHQPARFFPLGGDGGVPGLDQARQLQGKPLSYNNLMDAGAAVDIARDLAPLGLAAAVFKHMSPCGVAVARPGDDLAATYLRAREADAESAFGGIVSLTAPVDEATAHHLVETFLEVVVAPGFDDAAREILARKANLRLLELPRLGELPPVPPLRLRSIPGGLLAQREDEIRARVAAGRVATERAPTAEELVGLELAWVVVKHVRSNAIVLVADGVTVGIGGGQTSRVEASRQAARRAGDRARGAQLASDAFFPFRDGVDAAAEVGVTAVVQPGGSRRDQEVIQAANEHGLAMVLTSERHFRH